RPLVLPVHFLLDGPRSRPGRRIFNRDHVLKRVGIQARPALDEMQVLARPLEICLRTEIRHIDNQGIAVPPAAGISPPLPDRRRKMWTPVDGNHALPPLPLTCVIED